MSPPTQPSIVRNTLLLVLALGLATAPLSARQAEEIFVDTVDVDVVNVEVVVTDADGNPVHGLTREDFVVHEDGEPMELTNFYAVESARRIVGEDEAAPEEDDSAGSVHAPLPDDQRLNLVVLIDNLNISPTSRNRILGEIGDRLGEILRPGDRVLVAAANPEVRVVQTFTDDRSAVMGALEGLETTVSRGALLGADARLIRRSIDEAAGSLAAGGSPSGSGFGGIGDSAEDLGRPALESIRNWAAERHTLNLRLIETLERFVQALAGLPGRRAVLYVSEGFPVQPGEELIREWYQVFAQYARDLGVASPESEIARWDASSHLVALTEVAAGNHVAFYSLEAGGAFHGGLSAESKHISAPSRMADISTRGSLTDLAWRTGGVSLLDSGNVDHLLDRMASDYRDYYSLGYSSPRSNDEGYHRIEVEVPGRRVRVRHTQGYRAATPDQQTDERTLATLVFDVGSNPLGVRVEVGDEQREKGDRYVLPVLVRVPIAQLALIPRERVHQGRVSIVVAVQDSEGRLSKPQRLDLPVEIPNEKLLEAIGLQVAKGINLMVREGESKLAVGVHDELSGVRSTLNLTLSVGGR